ncbi:MAG: hypothetical protein HY747_03400 [Elusimicrobia bacterium]|nr:hypothetical protein [Elusimicrobiota bacterium]
MKYDGGLPGSFLEQASGARSLAMGKAFGAVAEGAGSLIWNPAGLSKAVRSEISLNYVSLFEGASLQEISLAHSSGSPVGIGASFIAYSFPGIVTRDASNNITGETKDEKTGVLFGVSAEPWGSGFLLGAAGKFLRQSIAGSSSRAADFDAGMLMDFGSVGLGFQAQNLLGAGFKREGGEDKLPRIYKIGMAVRFLGSAIVSAEGISKQWKSGKGGSEKAGSVSNARFGLEYTLFKTASLRAGLDGTLPSAGLGLNFGRIGMDYAVVSSPDLGISHRMSMRLGFGAAQDAKDLARGEWRKNYLVKAKKARKGEEKIPVPKGKKLQVAALDFTGRGLAELETGALSDFFRSALVNTNAFVVVERGDMDKIMEEQKFQQTGCSTDECAVQIGKILNVQKIFVGGVTLLQGVYYLNSKIVDVETSQVQTVRQARVGSVHEFQKAAEAMANGFAGLLVEIEPETKTEPEKKGR